jgi:hypothetical protein
MKKLFLSMLIILSFKLSYCWGFYAHKQINYLAVFLLPQEMLGYYKSNINYLADHAPDPDKRRYIVKSEAPRHYLDLDHYGKYPFPDLPRKWKDAVEKFSEDSLNAHGIAPWWIQVMLVRLTKAFANKNKEQVLKLSAEIGHYIADAHVPLHASSNHNGQYTNQHGIHGFWESRIPELLAEKEWDFFMDKAAYIQYPLEFMWDRMLESAAASDTVLIFERKLSDQYSADKKYAFENRNNQLVKQYSKAYSIQYNRMLKGMVERRMRQSVYAVASFWYTAWSNAGQPKLD